ncbi:hypothetical protein AK95_16205 [Paenibacillus sp. LC231]|uniref:hypothetical protein n=1 Tax=unclassified Paenibacillus TaxID=185978 RepID=UPI0008DE597A|nr:MULTISPECIES: hypothetical protein [unclassified Paenibacillus]MCT1401002.1 hypothetical protein [Paenibacillus sp. p3-SID867]OIA98704.1 hypothetical protein AK95_16205 [Paenibacillus sp. LC231]
MYKKYEIKYPRSEYVQVIISILITSILIQVLRIDDLLSVICVVILLLGNLIRVVMLLKRILRKNKELEITENTIRLNQAEVPIQQIEKIIIEGYFVQSIGIKLNGRKLVSMDFHFRFKNNEEINIEELKQWANRNRIKVTSGRIFRWI